MEVVPTNFRKVVSKIFHGGWGCQHLKYLVNIYECGSDENFIPGSWSKNGNHLFPDTPSKMSFEYLVKGVLMPSVSLFGLAGNFLSIYILHHREVKLKKDFVDVLCMLATFDNLLLLTTFFLFSLPTISSTWHAQVSKVI